MKQKEPNMFYDASLGAMVYKVSRFTYKAIPTTSYIPHIPKDIILPVVPLSGKALMVYLVLWRQSVMQRSLTVRLTTTEIRHWGVTHDQKTRALSALANAGLVVVEPQAGRNPLVTLRVDVYPWNLQTIPTPDV
jgi:hypothetical protein